MKIPGGYFFFDIKSLIFVRFASSLRPLKSRLGLVGGGEQPSSLPHGPNRPLSFFELWLQNFFWLQTCLFCDRRQKKKLTNFKSPDFTSAWKLLLRKNSEKMNCVWPNRPLPKIAYIARNFFWPEFLCISPKK